MNVVIFENEFQNIKTAFEAANLLYFKGTLQYKVCVTSQEFGDFNKIVEYDYAIVDIDLTTKSHMDGYQIISKILSLNSLVPKIIILTGHIGIEEQLHKKQLPSFPIISKPITFLSIRDALK